MLLAMLAGLGQNAAGNQIIVDTNGPTSNYIGWLGNPVASSFGQIFTAPLVGTNLTLDRFGFYIEGPATMSLMGYVYAWSGQAATGPALYRSDVTHLPGTGGFDLLEFDTQGLLLTGGSQYLLLLSTAELPQSEGKLTMKSMYPRGVVGGGFAVNLTHQDFDQIYSPSGWITEIHDTAFRATFSGTGVAMVPEPGALSLLLLGTAGACAIRCYRRRGTSLGA